MKKRIGELLIEAGACSDNDVREALGHQRAWASNQKLGQVLVSVGKVTPTAVARALALQFDVPFVKLPEIPEKVSRTVPINYQEENKIIPFRLEVEGKSERLHIAVADPSNLELVDELRFELRKTVRIYVAATDDIAQAIATLKGESLEEIQPLEIEEEEAPLVIERDSSSSVASGGYFTPAPEKKEPELPEQFPEEWSLGPTPAADAPKAKNTVSSDIDDLFGDTQPLSSTKPAEPAKPPAAEAKPAAKAPEPPPAAAAKPAADADEVAPFAAVVEDDIDTEESWGAALLPGANSGTAPRTTSKPETPSVAAPPTQPPPADVGSTASPTPAAAGPKSVSAPPPQEPKPSAAATPPQTELPTSTRPPTGAVLNKAEPSQTAAPTTEPEKPPEPKKAAVEEKPAEQKQEKLEFSDDDLKILEDIERLASGAEPKSESEKVRPAQMVASLIRLLIKKGVIHELEFLDELARK